MCVGAHASNSAGDTAGVRERGFTYFTVPILVTIMGVGLAAIGTMWQQAERRD